MDGSHRCHSGCASHHDATQTAHRRFCVHRTSWPIAQHVCTSPCGTVRQICRNRPPNCELWFRTGCDLGPSAIDRHRDRVARPLNSCAARGLAATQYSRADQNPHGVLCRLPVAARRDIVPYRGCARAGLRRRNAIRRDDDKESSMGISRCSTIGARAICAAIALFLQLPSANACVDDNECKGDRICVNGHCRNPDADDSGSSVPARPARPPQRSGTATMCVTNFGWCAMTQAIPVGWSCYCATVAGPIAGIAQ